MAKRELVTQKEGVVPYQGKEAEVRPFLGVGVVAEAHHQVAEGEEVDHHQGKVVGEGVEDRHLEMVEGEGVGDRHLEMVEGVVGVVQDHLQGVGEDRLKSKESLLESLLYFKAEERLLVTSISRATFSTGREDVGARACKLASVINVVLLMRTKGPYKSWNLKLKTGSLSTY